MATITPNLKLQLLEYGQADYATVLNANFEKISFHDHSRGKIVSIDAIKVTFDMSFAKKFIYEDFSIRSCKFLNFFENFEEVEKKSFYSKNGDFYYRDGFSREIQITSNKSLVVQTNGFGFFSGDMAVSGAKVEYSNSSGYNFLGNTGLNFAIIEANTLKCDKATIVDLDVQNLYLETLNFNLTGITTGQQVIKATTGQTQLQAQSLNFPSTVATILSRITNYSTTPQSTFQTTKTLGIFANKLKTRSTTVDNLTTFNCDTRQILKQISGRLIITQQKIGGRGIDEFCLFSGYTRGIKEMCPTSNTLGNYLLNWGFSPNIISALNVVK